MLLGVGRCSGSGVYNFNKNDVSYQNASDLDMLLVICRVFLIIKLKIGLVKLKEQQ